MRGRYWLLRKAAIAAFITAGVLVASLGVMSVVWILIALVVAVVAMAFTVAPWLLLGYGGYALVRNGRRRRRALPYAYAPHGWCGRPWWVARRAASDLPEPVAVPPPAAAPDPLARLPEDVRAAIERIRRKAGALLQHGDRFPAGSRDLYLVQRTLNEYLPATLDAYVALPPGSDDWPTAPDGRTGLQVLRDQLKILEAKLDEVSGEVWRRNVQQLLANERFLEQYVGRPEPEELTIPSGRG